MKNKLLHFSVWFDHVVPGTHISTVYWHRQNRDQLYKNVSYTSLARIDRIMQDAPLLKTSVDSYGLTVSIIVRAG